LSNSWLPTACTDEIARRDQDAVPILGAKLLDERRGIVHGEYADIHRIGAFWADDDDR